MKSRLKLGAASAALAFAISTPAAAQTNTPNDVSAQEQGQEITVTGSRIPRPNLDSSVPVTSVTAVELVERGDVSIGDALNELPSLRSTYSQSNSTRFIGTAGINRLDLRGLGTSRTLVLVNGRRHVTALPGGTDVDTNTIPTDLLERVDIITGGNSAIYGSDAVAGVVNFVLKRDFEGITARGQAGISSKGDRGQYFTSLTAGRNFADGRGNVAISAEYARQNQLLVTSRNDLTGAFTGQIGYFAAQSTLNEPSTGDGIPDTTFYRDLRSTQYSSGGGVILSCPTTAAAGESAAAFANRRSLVCTGLRDPSGGEVPFAFFFAPNGDLVRNDAAAGVRGDLRPFGSNNTVGGLGSTFNETGQLFPQLDRKSVNLLASYEVSPAFKPFIEAKYVRVDSLQESSPIFQGGVLSPTMRRDNPFITAQARAVLDQILAPSATTFTLARNNVDFGARAEDHNRDTYRIVAGVNGEITSRVRYEAVFNYGRTDTYYETGGNVLLQNYRNAQDAARDPVSGQIVCRVNIDADPSNNDPSCVPLNLFGDGRPSQAALDYVLVRSFRNERAEQMNALAFVSADSGGFLRLPGGPIGVVVGGEWRRETASSVYDPIVSNPVRQTFLNATSPFLPPALEVFEGFGEIRIPLLADLPFVRELTVEGAGRVSKYNFGPQDPVFAWNAGVVYSPVRDLRFRAGLARAVRAPSLGDLFTSELQTFRAITDPCSQTQINNNPNRVRNCAAAGVPTTFTLTNGTQVPFVNNSTSTPGGVIRGNPNVEEERSTSLTIGAIFEPRFIPGFTFTVDYYRIKIDNVIASLQGQTVVNLCYDDPTGINNQYCAAVFRRPDGTFAGQPGISVGGEIKLYDPDSLSPSFFEQPFNFAKYEAEGIDFDASYRTDLGSAQLNLRAIVTWVLDRQNYTSVTQPDFGTRLHGTLGDPELAASASIGLDFGNWDLQYNFRYVGRQAIAAWETQNSHQGRPPTNPDAFPEVFYSPITYSNLRLGVSPTQDFKFYLGVDNVFDQMPPERSGLFGTGAGGAIYPVTGRYFYSGVEFKF